MSDQEELFQVTEAKRPSSMSRGDAVGHRAGDSYEATGFEPDAARGGALRDEGITRSDEAAKAEWKRAADEAVSFCARTRERLTTDDVWRAMPHGVREVREPRAMGAVMIRAAKAGLIVRTSATEESSISRSHRRPKAVWQSLVSS
tara:strand:- start:45 stop:482 length:438 start_codon:yes stop_codon:yes gene_type:complete